MVRVAVVGCGAVTELSADSAWPRLAGLGQVVATVDTRADRAEAMAERLGARPYASLAAALEAERIDAVDVRVPHRAHAAVALEAIAAGCHVLVEKPIAMSIEDGLRIVEAAEAAGVVCAVAENYAFFEPIDVARDVLAAGGIGEILTVRTHRVLEIGGIWVRDGWRHDAGQAGGGVLIDQGCHHANLLRRLIGEVVAVQAYASERRPGWIGEDTVTVSCRFENGLIGQQLYCWGTPTPARGAEAYVYGTEGSLEIRVTYSEPGGGVVRFAPHRPEGEWLHEGADYDQTFLPTLEDWLRACRGERRSGMPGREGVADLAVVLATYAAIASGREELVSAGGGGRGSPTPAAPPD